MLNTIMFGLIIMCLILVFCMCFFDNVGNIKIAYVCLVLLGIGTVLFFVEMGIRIDKDKDCRGSCLMEHGKKVYADHPGEIKDGECRCYFKGER